MTSQRILAIDPGPERSAWLVVVEADPEAPAGKLTFGELHPGASGSASTTSAWLVWDCRLQVITHPTNMGIVPNAQLLDLIRLFHGFGDAVVIEQVASYGMPVGAEVFETVYWSGRFAEVAYPVPVHRLTRKAIVTHLCGSVRAKDSNVRQALIDRFGGKEKAIGRKGSEGPLYGIHADLWSALAVAVTFADSQEATR